ncbi:MAG: CusA/CzcA family heavy metal efflux RND transporter [Bacteroidales bacterium]|jgi:cobalt-zinc-cadmium resistance protein CzcA|nr:CusA/CzcA family heavy metal efflux RND transporter [Bacteroidales bacterium]
MLNRIINFSIRNKLIALLLTVSVAGFGVFALFQIPLGAVPDITKNQVQVITTSTNLSTQDVEQFITYPVELEMSNLPGVIEIRSISKFGLSVVTIVFEDKMGTYLPRQLIAEKIKNASANIPEGFGVPEMGPITTGLGEIYQYILDTEEGYEDKYSIMELRTIQDWIVKRQLSGIPGVVEVNTWGGNLKQYEVAMNPEVLLGMGLSLLDVYEAISKNNSVAGGAYIEREHQSYFIRGDGLVSSLDDIENIVVTNRNGHPVLVRDVAKVGFGSANRFGAITANGEGEKVMGQIMMLKDANSNKVIDAVKGRVEEVQESLPEGVFINPILERSELIGKTSFTVFENLLFGCLIVFFIVVLMMGNLRSGLVVASLIPLSLLFTISLMYVFGIDAKLMSLGALDFGIIIDGAVIIVEFIVIKLSLQRQELNASSGLAKREMMDKITLSGASKMMNSAIFGQVIILIVFIPVVSLSGVEGKMFRPMALSFSFALIGAMFFGLIWLPVASSLFLKPEKEKQFVLTRLLMNLFYRSYDPVIKWSYNHKKVILGMALASLVLTGFIFSRMGGEFVPTLDEGDFVIQPVLKTGTSLSQTIELTTQMEQILIKEFPEVDQIVCRIGAAEVPTDPMSMEEIDMIIKLNPKDEWVSAKSKEDLANLFKEALQVIPGIDYEFTQPIEMRFNELITGVRSDLAIKIFGDDLSILAEKAEDVKSLITGVEGAADIILEKTEGLPQMSVKYKRNRVAFYGLSIEELNKYLTTAFGGGIAGSVFEGERRFDLVARLQPEYRVDIDNIRNLYVALPNGSQVPFSELAEIEYTIGPAKISRDDTKRRVVVGVNVRNRDLESVVSDVESILDENLNLPAGYYVEYGGQFENLRNASRRLKIAVPIALILIFIFLHFAFGSFKEAALVFTAIPLSIVGGVFFLWIRGMPFSISAGIGFIALFGVAVLNGIVLIDHLKDLKKEGIIDMKERVLRGTRERLRPVLLTASAAALGFLPMAISHSAGAEVQRPLATVVIGGLVTSTLLTMLALPILYSIFDDVTGITLWPPRLKRNKIIPIILFLLIPSFAFGQSDKNKNQAAVLDLGTAIEIAHNNNHKLAAYKAKMEESRALIKTAFSIDKMQVYYNYDENNVAENNSPIGVIGGEQRFEFPSVYLAQKEAMEMKTQMAMDEVDVVKSALSRDVSMQYYRVVHLKNIQKKYAIMDSIYTGYSSRAEFGFEQGEMTQLEVLNAKAKQNQVQILQEKLAYDIQIALSEMATLMNYDSAFTIPAKAPVQILLNPMAIELDPGLKYMEHSLLEKEAELKLERNKLLPDLTLGYFNGTNSKPGAKSYQGFELGLGIPLFFGEQKARIKAGQYAALASESFSLYYMQLYENRISEKKAILEKHLQSIQYYKESGQDIAKELFSSAQKSLDEGEIDFFRFVQSIDAALEIELDYLQSLNMYNEVVLEINYLIL